MLHETSKLACFLTNDSFELFWSEIRFIMNVKIIHKICKCETKFPFCSEHAPFVQVILKYAEQEIFMQAF